MKNLRTDELLASLKAARAMLAYVGSDEKKELLAQIHQAEAEMGMRREAAIKEGPRMETILEFKVAITEDWSQKFVIQKNRDGQFHIFRQVPKGLLSLHTSWFDTVKEAVSWAENQVLSNGGFPD